MEEKGGMSSALESIMLSKMLGSNSDGMVGFIGIIILLAFVVLLILVIMPQKNNANNTFLDGKNTQQIDDIKSATKALLDGQVVINNNITNRSNETNSLIATSTVGTRDLIVSNYNELTALINTLPKV